MSRIVTATVSFASTYFLIKGIMNKNQKITLAVEFLKSQGFTKESLEKASIIYDVTKEDIRAAFFSGTLNFTQVFLDEI